MQKLVTVERSNWHVGRFNGTNTLVRVSPDYPSRTAAKRREMAVYQGMRFPYQRATTMYGVDFAGYHFAQWVLRKRERLKICCGEEMKPYWYISIYRHLPDGPKDFPLYKCTHCNSEIERFDEL